MQIKFEKLGNGRDYMATAVARERGGVRELELGVVRGGVTVSSEDGRRLAGQWRYEMRYPIRGRRVESFTCDTFADVKARISEMLWVACFGPDAGTIR